MKLEWIKSNPVAHATGIAHTVVGYHNWTDDEIDQYRARHSVGTMARAALEIMLWTAQRGGDAHRFGPQHMKGDKIEFAPDKAEEEGRSRPIFRRRSRRSWKPLSGAQDDRDDSSFLVP